MKTGEKGFGTGWIHLYIIVKTYCICILNVDFALGFGLAQTASFGGPLGVPSGAV